MSHLLLTVLVQKNNGALRRIHDLEVMGFLLDQISTPWNICYHEIFGHVEEGVTLQLDILEK